MKKNIYNNIAKSVIDLEIKALRSLKSSINNSFNDAVNAIVNCQSKIILCGVGKSGLIAAKISATLSSIAYYLSERTVSLSDSSIYESFKYKLDELADIHSLDLILYNLEGDLLLNATKDANQPKFLPSNLEVSVIEDLTKSRARLTKILKTNGHEYLNSYQFLYDTNSLPFAIISIPYFQLNESYKRDLQVYFIALTPIYLLLFLITSLFAFLLSKQISEPIVKLSSVMQEAALAKQYMPLSWNSADEVGRLVKHYNFMVKELQISSEKLAQKEKESAWKGMAKQVAHEIKNPLTPMKLNIQMFERKINPQDPEFPIKLKKFTSSLIKQLDTLANIASAFSDFARLWTDQTFTDYIGAGLGLSFEVQTGIFGISLAVGKLGESPFDFSSPKVHFGFINQF